MDLSKLSFPQTTKNTAAFKQMAQNQQGGMDAGGGNDGGGAPQAQAYKPPSGPNVSETFDKSLKRAGEDSAWLDDGDGGYGDAGDMAEDVTG